MRTSCILLLAWTSACSTEGQDSPPDSSVEQPGDAGTSEEDAGATADAPAPAPVVADLGSRDVVLDYVFIRWDDGIPGLCLADRVVNDQCGRNQTGDRVALFVRYILGDNLTADIVLAQSSLLVVEGAAVDSYLVTEGTLVFASYDATGRMAAGTIDITLGTSATAAGDFVVMD